MHGVNIKKPEEEEEKKKEQKQINRYFMYVIIKIFRYVKMQNTAHQG